MSQRRARLASVIENPDRCYQAAQSKDARFDGQFFCAVTSTGIYCRPSCPARTPKRENMRFYATAAAAQQAGFRACLRCRPDATPSSTARASKDWPAVSATAPAS
jgi:AraC family transcriptional regulator of adaptative response / DNA-3-methyladenine glycosylase II